VQPLEVLPPEAGELHEEGCVVQMLEEAASQKTEHEQLLA
ncbi:unnamed protein product, partial [uncultured virus]